MNSNPMTPSLPKVADMSDEEINLSIAEALGWQITKAKGYEDDPRYWSFVPPGKKPMKDCNYTARPGDYCRSLDAMHKAEKTLPPRNRVGDGGYMDHLWSIVVRDGAPRGGCTWDIATATAKQRAQAFLLATGRARA